MQKLDEEGGDAAANDTNERRPAAKKKSNNHLQERLLEIQRLELEKNNLNADKEMIENELLKKEEHLRIEQEEKSHLQALI